MDTAPPAYLHLLAPEPQLNNNLCKTVLSGAILGYPEATLTSWNTLDKAEGSNGNVHIKKIIGVQNYLNKLHKGHDEDLVLIIDGDDTWFQLRPQTLLDRYFTNNRRANQQLRAGLGELAGKNGIRQSILFASQRHCFPWTAKDPACYAVPPSTLPSDTYGAETDRDTGDQKDPYAKHRARYLSSGFILGPVSGLRTLYNEAAKRASADSNLKTDQQVFSQLFGEQSLHRDLLRRDSQSSAHRLSKWVSSSFKDAALSEQDAAAAVNYRDYGIGLDYSSTLAFNTIYASSDAEWLTHTNASQKAVANKARGISKSRIEHLTTDIAASLPPFWTFSTDPLPRSLTWENVSLLTNVWTGETPALIRHDPRQDEASALRQKTWWGHMWFQAYARTLYDVHISAPIAALAVSGEDARRQWWSLEDWRGGMRNASGAWIRYDDVCYGTQDEVFRDGKGPWWLPANH